MIIEQLTITKDNLIDAMSDKDVYIVRMFMNGKKLGTSSSDDIAYPPRYFKNNNNGIYPVFTPIGQTTVKEVLDAINDSASSFFKILEYPIPLKPGDIPMPTTGRYIFDNTYEIE